jgi:hypothetical protein
MLDNMKASFSSSPKRNPSGATDGPALLLRVGYREADTEPNMVLALDDGVQALAYHIGFDRAAAKQHPLYLRLLHASRSHGSAPRRSRPRSGCGTGSR